MFNYLIVSPLFVSNYKFFTCLKFKKISLKLNSSHNLQYFNSNNQLNHTEFEANYCELPFHKFGPHTHTHTHARARIYTHTSSLFHSHIRHLKVCAHTHKLSFSLSLVRDGEVFLFGFVPPTRFCLRERMSMFVALP